MIKVVATKKKAIQPKKIQCCVCQSELEYMQNDVENGRIECPVCGCAINEDGYDTPVFPDTFYRFGENKLSYKLNKEQIASYVNKTVEEMKKLKPGDYYYIASGDTIVFGVKNDEQTSIFVCKNYWEDSYDFQ